MARWTGFVGGSGGDGGVLCSCSIGVLEHVRTVSGTVRVGNR